MELFIETPSSLNIQSFTWSSYKHYNTFKGLVGISPTGTYIFVSRSYTWSISDQEITITLNLVKPGNAVMADKGFDISYKLLIRGCHLIFLRLLGVGICLSLISLRHVLRASLHIHVEQAIGCNTLHFGIDKHKMFHSNVGLHTKAKVKKSSPYPGSNSVPSACEPKALSSERQGVAAKL